MINCLGTNKYLQGDELPHFHTAHVRVGMREKKKLSGPLLKVRPK